VSLRVLLLVKLLLVDPVFVEWALVMHLLKMVDLFLSSMHQLLDSSDNTSDWVEVFNPWEVILDEGADWASVMLVQVLKVIVTLLLVTVLIHLNDVSELILGVMIMVMTMSTEAGMLPLMVVLILVWSEMFVTEWAFADVRVKIWDH